MSEQKPVCVICNGKYPFASETAFGIRPNKFKKDMPDILICWECVHWLHKEFGEHIRNFSYTLLFVNHGKLKPDNVLENCEIKDQKEKDIC